MDGAICSDRNLGRIVALLAALAVLAERAAERSFLVRWLILTVLRRGEVAARAFVAEATLCEFPSLGEPGGLGYGPDEAILLAAQFRALASLLAAILPAEGFAGAGQGAGVGRLVDGMPFSFLAPCAAAGRVGRTARPEATGPPHGTRSRSDGPSALPLTCLPASSPRERGEDGWHRCEPPDRNVCDRRSHR